jgi:hypothetical protein
VARLDQHGIGAEEVFGIRPGDEHAVIGRDERVAEQSEGGCRKQDRREMPGGWRAAGEGLAHRLEAVFRRAHEIAGPYLFDGAEPGGGFHGCSGGETGHGADRLYPVRPCDQPARAGGLRQPGQIVERQRMRVAHGRLRPVAPFGQFQRQPGAPPRRVPGIEHADRGFRLGQRAVENGARSRRALHAFENQPARRLEGEGERAVPAGAAPVGEERDRHVGEGRQMCLDQQRAAGEHALARGAGLQQPAAGVEDRLPAHAAARCAAGARPARRMCAS